MSQKTEGTLELDGLVEGRLGPDPSATQRLEEWTRVAQGMGLRFDLEVEGNGFSLLAATEPVRAAALGGDPTSQIRHVLEQLAQAFGEVERAQLFSTLRSTEYTPGRETQTVYVLKPDGSVDAQQRTLEARTTPPPEAPRPKDLLKAAGVSLLVLAALFGITSFFVDWGGMLKSVWRKVVPLEVADVEVDGTRFAEFLRVEGKERGAGSKSVVLTLARTDAYPLDDDAVAAALARSPLPFERRLALEALARGYVRVEIFDERGRFLGFRDVRVHALRTNEKARVEVPVPRDPRPARLVLGY